MAIMNKPDEHIFASNAQTGEVDTFPDLLRGWGITFEQTQGIPPMEWFNYLFQRIDERMLYLLQRGLPEWSETLDYPQGAYVQYNKKTYRSLQANQGKRPEASSEYWRVWGVDADNYVAESQKSSAIDSDSEETVATSLAVKKVKDKAEQAATQATAAGKKGLPVGAIVAFPKEITNQLGFLKCDGNTFNQATYPDLHQVLGNKNKLPDLHRSDVGMTSYFAVDNIPEGWIAFDSIRTTVTQQRYPELYALLVAKYGAINNVPLAEDRFIRNVSNSLAVGQTQDDEIKKHVHSVGHYAVDNPGDNYFTINNNYVDANIRNTHFYDTNVSNNTIATPKLDSFYATGGEETRPKAIALKLCIKAQNTFDRVQFWIKAYGEVVNEGQLDAATLAQDLHNKANKQHTHQASDIVDFNDNVNAMINAAFTQSFGENGWCKLPNGLILQWGHIRGTGGDIVQFPIPFRNQLCNLQVTARISAVDSDRQDSLGTYNENLSGFTLFSWISPMNGLFWWAVGY